MNAMAPFNPGVVGSNPTGPSSRPLRQPSSQTAIRTPLPWHPSEGLAREIWGSRLEIMRIAAAHPYSSTSNRFSDDVRRFQAKE